MLRFARLGWVGFNWHGGGNGHYSPLVGAPSTGFSRRPEFYGIQFAQLLTGATFVPATLTGASRFVTAYAVERQGVRKVAIVNKDLTPATITLPVPAKPDAIVLSGPARAATRTEGRRAGERGARTCRPRWGRIQQTKKHT